MVILCSGRCQTVSVRTTAHGGMGLIWTLKSLQRSGRLTLRALSTSDWILEMYRVWIGRLVCHPSLWSKSVSYTIASEVKSLWTKGTDWQKHKPWYMIYCIIVQVVPGRAGGGSFRRKKNCIAKKEFAYRMCARRPTSAMPKPFLCCERAFCCSTVVMWPVLMSWSCLRGEMQ